MDILTGGLFIGCIALFTLTLIVRRPSIGDGLYLTILSLMITIMSIGAGLNDAELLSNYQGSIVLITEAIIGIMTIPKLLYYCGVDD